MVCETLLAYEVFGLLNGGLVVRGNEEHAVFFKVLNHMEHTVVVAGVRLLDSVPDR